MKYIELYGLPGAGKTTISTPVIRQLRREGLSVADLNSIYKRKCMDGKKKVFLEMLRSLKEYPIYYHIIRYGLSTKLSFDSVKYLIKLLFLVHQLIKTKEEEKYDIVLCDEGIIQYFTSLCYVDELPENASLRKCLYKINEILKIEAIYCIISIEDSLERITGRGEGTSRRFSSRTTRDVLQSALQFKIINLSRVAKFVPSVHELYLGENLEVNITELLSLVCRILTISEVRSN